MDVYLLRAASNLLSVVVYVGLLFLNSPFEEEEVASLRDRLPFLKRHALRESS